MNRRKRKVGKLGREKQQRKEVCIKETNFYIYVRESENVYTLLIQCMYFIDFAEQRDGDDSHSHHHRHHHPGLALTRPGTFAWNNPAVRRKQQHRIIITALYSNVKE